MLLPEVDVSSKNVVKECGEVHKGDKEGFAVFALVVCGDDLEVVAELRVAEVAEKFEFIVRV